MVFVSLDHVQGLELIIVHFLSIRKSVLELKGARFCRFYEVFSTNYVLINVFNLPERFFCSLQFSEKNVRKRSEIGLL